MIYKPGKDAVFKLMPSKDPDAVSKPYTILLRGNLPGDTTSEPATFIPEGVSIVSATTTIKNDDLLIVSALSVTSNYVIIWLSGGTLDATATVTVHFVTDLSDGVGGVYSDDVSFMVSIKHR